MPGRHEQILQCIYEKLLQESTDQHLYDEIHIEDYSENEAPSRGIVISPLGEREQIGTNERDDVDYETVIIRTVHSLGDDDREEKSCFRENIRKLFHNKRIVCDDSCILYSRVDFGRFAIPQAWFNDNNSVTAMRVFTLVRESRT